MRFSMVPSNSRLFGDKEGKSAQFSEGVSLKQIHRTWLKRQHKSQ